jgi:uncharacterized membrane protein YhhN
MLGAMMTYLLITVAGLAVVLAAEWRGIPGVQWVAKPVASLGFVAFAMASGAVDSLYGQWLLAGLVLSFAGDVLLIPKKTSIAFMLGLAAFLLGHVAYAAAFLVRGLQDAASLMVAVPLLALAGGILWWLWPRLDARFKVAVPLYVAAITTMLTCAFATTMPSGRPVALWLGALLFYVSDLSVARNRFVSPGFSNRAWGLPAYYAGQLLLASTVAGY